MKTIKFLGLALGFFASLGFAFLCGWLMLQANFGILEVAEFDSELWGWSSQEFTTYMFATLALSWMGIAFGLMKGMEALD